ncbi:MAG: hypothetical protein ACOYNI_00665 [Acidimicrobiia bacterium]
MKKYRFPLATVLRVRRIEEERAKAELLRANRETHDAEVVVETRTQHLRALPTPADADSPGALRGQHDQGMIAAASASFAASALVAKRAAAAARRSEWADAQMRVNALERLDDRMREGHAVEVVRAEQNVIDDLVAARARRTIG